MTVPRIRSQVAATLGKTLSISPAFFFHFSAAGGVNVYREKGSGFDR
jgi:hypothetical protein